VCNREPAHRLRPNQTFRDGRHKCLAAHVMSVDAPVAASQKRRVRVVVSQGWKQLWASLLIRWIGARLSCFWAQHDPCHCVNLCWGSSPLRGNHSIARANLDPKALLAQKSYRPPLHPRRYGAALSRWNWSSGRIATRGGTRAHGIGAVHCIQALIVAGTSRRPLRHESGGFGWLCR